ncbi:MAG TPA: FHA domain-containing protein, partial [Polyangiaceae bacterium]|nr:FHA domain-containing protein [Polyangiaceae bacterium]
MSAKPLERRAAPSAAPSAAPPAAPSVAPPGPDAARPRAERPGASAAPRAGAPWTLTIEDEDGQRTRVALAREAYALGRDPACDVPLAQHNVSRRHALLAREADGAWALRDLGSRYGTFVNGKRVEGSCPLTHRDMVQVGDFLLTLTSEASRALPDERALDLPPKEANEPLHDRPDRVRVFGSLVSPSREVRLDRGPVFVGADHDCAVRTPPLAFAPRLQIRPLISRYGDRDTSLDGGRRPPVGPRYEILDESATPCLLVNSRPLKSKVLDDDDIVELADHREVDEDYAFRAQRTFALRYLRRGRSSWTHATPPPLHDTWTPPNLPINLPQERVEHGWANVSGPPSEPASVEIEIDIDMARRDAP